MQKKKIYICPVCGSTNTTVYDRRSVYLDGVKFWCDDCGLMVYAKDIDDLDFKDAPKVKKAKEDRTMATRRRTTYIKAIRKKKISDSYLDSPYYNHIHQYSKNKIHCSCPLCAAKSKGNRGYNLKISELRNMGISSLKRQTAKLSISPLNALIN